MPLRLVFFGTPQLAVPTLEALIAGPHPVVGVVSQPDRGRGRGRRTSPSPVSAVAERESLPLLRPEKVGAREAVEVLESWKPDLGVVVAFGQFIPRRVRELPREGYLINAHASLLPRHRGAAPIQHAILAGDPETGISVMRVEREMDAGAVALVRTTPIDPAENAGELGERLSRLAAEAIAEAIEQIAAGRVAWRAQDDAAATLAGKIERDDARIDWRAPAPRIARLVRAMAPRPGAATQLDDEPLRILAAQADLSSEVGVPPGTAGHGPDAPLRVATSEGWLEVRRLQRAGGKPLDVDAFLRGRPIADGAVLG